jgi:hypothetical protein
MNEARTYPLGYTEEESRRFASQAAFFEDLTADVLRRAGIGAGMKLLDPGCRRWGRFGACGPQGR